MRDDNRLLLATGVLFLTQEPHRLVDLLGLVEVIFLIGSQHEPQSAEWVVTQV